MKFPTLFKKTSTGAIQQWTISVKFEQPGQGWARPYSAIYTVHGQVDGKLQTTSDNITTGKNIGKKNETTHVEQAEEEAKSRWEKKKKSGYVENLTSAENDELDSVIEGGIVPMLAHTFEKQGHKIKYPCLTQGKYDGIRLIAMVNNTKATLWTRTRKRVHSLPHLINEIESLNLPNGTILDGEAYNDLFKTNFEHIAHLVRQDSPDLNCTDVEYHVYDMVSKEKFSSRSETLKKYLQNTKYLKPVPTYLVESEDQVVDFFNKFKSEGLEGAMLRNSDSLYVNKRSYDLQKVKEMQDAEFEIVGIEEGRGKLSGHVGAFICATSDGQEFKAKMSGSTERLREYFLDHSLWEGRELVVQFQDLTSYGIPRFPVGLRLKERI